MNSLVLLVFFWKFLGLWQTLTCISLKDMGQMVCGVCRSLLSYPKGAMHVKCPECQTTNRVLEGHQIGLVKCRSCFVLLMYNYESPSVRCSCCRAVTEISVENKRPLILPRPPPIVQ
ncbi:hypothetical protein ACHQM5_003183 [Ranunculus cassubicifolius]